MRAVWNRYRPGGDERVFPRGFYVWTERIEEVGWSEGVWFDIPGFDLDVFWDDDGGDGDGDSGKVYLSTTMRVADRAPDSQLKDFGIHVSEVDLHTGRSLTPPVCIRQSEFGVAEGNHVIKKGGWYYLFVAEGGTEAGHHEWVFRSREGVYGPWESRG